MNGSALLDAALYAVGLVAAFGLATARRRRRVGPGLLARPRARLRHLPDQAGLPRRSRREPRDRQPAGQVETSWAPGGSCTTASCVAHFADRSWKI